MVVFYQQPNYERFQVASDECTISRKTDSLYRRKLREQSMLHVKRVTLELRIPEGISLRGRCVRLPATQMLRFRQDLRCEATPERLGGNEIGRDAGKQADRHLIEW